MDKNQDPGSGTNNPDPQYWSRPFFLCTIPYGRTIVLILVVYSAVTLVNHQIQNKLITVLGSNVLLISGFDGAIYTWDINQYSENNLEFEKVR